MRVFRRLISEQIALFEICKSNGWLCYNENHQKKIYQSLSKAIFFLNSVLDVALKSLYEVVYWIKLKWIVWFCARSKNVSIHWTGFRVHSVQVAYKEWRLLLEKGHSFRKTVTDFRKFSRFYVTEGDVYWCRAATIWQIQEVEVIDRWYSLKFILKIQFNLPESLDCSTSIKLGISSLMPTWLNELQSKILIISSITTKISTTLIECSVKVYSRCTINSGGRCERKYHNRWNSQLCYAKMFI